MQWLTLPWINCCTCIRTRWKNYYIVYDTQAKACFTSLNNWKNNNGSMPHLFYLLSLSGIESWQFSFKLPYKDLDVRVSPKYSSTWRHCSSQLSLPDSNVFHRVSFTDMDGDTYKSRLATFLVPCWLRNID